MFKSLKSTLIYKVWLLAKQRNMCVQKSSFLLGVSAAKSQKIDKTINQSGDWRRDGRCSDPQYTTKTILFFTSL